MKSPLVRMSVSLSWSLLAHVCNRIWETASIAHNNTDPCLSWMPLHCGAVSRVLRHSSPSPVNPVVENVNTKSYTTSWPHVFYALTLSKWITRLGAGDHSSYKGHKKSSRTFMYIDICITRPWQLSAPYVPHTHPRVYKNMKPSRWEITTRHASIMRC